MPDARPPSTARNHSPILHDRLFADVECDRAWLVCPAHEAPLRAFYERRGWLVLALDDLGTGTERAVPGLDLSVRRDAAAALRA